MSRDNMRCVPLHLQPNSDGPLVDRNRISGFISTALGCPAFMVAASGFGMPTNSVILPNLLMPKTMSGLSELVVDNCSLTPVISYTADYRSEFGKVQQIGRHDVQITEIISNAALSLSTFNKWNMGQMGIDKYPHSRQSELPPGTVRTRLKPHSSGWRDKGGTTVS